MRDEIGNNVDLHQGWLRGFIGPARPLWERGQRRSWSCINPQQEGEESPVRQGDPLWALEETWQDLCHVAATWI